MKSLHIAIILLILPILIYSMNPIAPQSAFGTDPAYQTTLEKQFGNADTTKLVHGGSVLILNQTTHKLVYKMGENITISTELINIGNKTVSVGYLEPKFFLEIKKETEK